MAGPFMFNNEPIVPDLEESKWIFDTMLENTWYPEAAIQGRSRHDPSLLSLLCCHHSMSICQPWRECGIYKGSVVPAESEVARVTAGQCLVRNRLLTFYLIRPSPSISTHTTHHNTAYFLRAGPSPRLGIIRICFSIACLGTCASQRRIPSRIRQHPVV